jgi:hypothetical protein
MEAQIFCFLAVKCNKYNVLVVVYAIKKEVLGGGHWRYFNVLFNIALGNAYCVLLELILDKQY